MPRITLQHPHGYLHVVRRPDGTMVNSVVEAEADGSAAKVLVAQATLYAEAKFEELRGPFEVTCTKCGGPCRVIGDATVRAKACTCQEHARPRGSGCDPRIHRQLLRVEVALGDVRLVWEGADNEGLAGKVQGLFLAATREDFEAGVARLRELGWPVDLSLAGV